jgi:allophanate hydrolase subunit 1
MVVAIPRISPAGSGALLFDSAKGAFSDAVQRRIWAISEVVLRLEGVRETAPGMNNLLVLFDPLIVDAADVGALLQTLWAQADAVDVVGVSTQFPSNMAAKPARTSSIGRHIAD